MWAFILFLSMSLAANGITLKDSFDAALKQSELVAQQEQLILQQEERYNQAIGGLLPTISAVGSVQVQDSSRISATGSNFFPGFQPLARVNATQPLFRGFREFAALRQAKNQTQAQRFARAQAETQLYLDVAQTFYEILMLEADRHNLEEESELFDKRLQEVQSRAKIGRARDTEALNVRSSAASLRAQSKNVEGRWLAAREMFAFLTGLDAKVKLESIEKSPPLFKPVAEFLSGVEKRPDVLNAAKAAEAADDGIALAKGQHWPSIDLSANYYFKRAGIQENVKWDAMVGLTFPLFQGGAIQSQVRSATSAYTQAELQKIRVQRQAEQAVRAAFQSANFAKEEAEQLKEAEKIGKQNFLQHTQEYRLGLVSNVDVLLALSNYRQQKRSLDRSELSSVLEWIRLEVASAIRP